MSTELEAKAAAELAEIEALEAQAAAAGKAALADERIQVPRLAVVQGTSKNPPEGSSPGDFVDTVTGQNFGSELTFLVAHFQRGRFWSEKDDRGRPTGKTAVAGPELIAPPSWPEQYRGQVFSELSDAEERYSEAANAGEIPWGSGPPIATTYNFTGFVTSVEAEGAIPVRLSLKSSDTPTAKKIITLLKPLPTLWGKTVVLRTERATSDQGTWFAVKADSYGEAPDVSFRKKAIELSLAADQVGLNEQGDLAEATATDDEEPAGDADAPKF